MVDRTAGRDGATEWAQQFEATRKEREAAGALFAEAPTWLKLRISMRYTPRCLICREPGAMLWPEGPMCGQCAASRVDFPIWLSGPPWPQQQSRHCSRPTTQEEHVARSRRHRRRFRLPLGLIRRQFRVDATEVERMVVRAVSRLPDETFKKQDCSATTAELIDSLRRATITISVRGVAQRRTCCVIAVDGSAYAGFSRRHRRDDDHHNPCVGAKVALRYAVIDMVEQAVGAAPSFRLGWHEEMREVEDEEGKTATVAVDVLRAGQRWGTGGLVPPIEATGRIEDTSDYLPTTMVGTQKDWMASLKDFAKMRSAVTSHQAYIASRTARLDGATLGTNEQAE